MRAQLQVNDLLYFNGTSAKTSAAVLLLPCPSSGITDEEQVKQHEDGQGHYGEGATPEEPKKSPGGRESRQ